MRSFVAMVVCVLTLGSAKASNPVAIDPPSAEELAKIMRTMMMAAVPTPLVEQSFNWGHQKNVPVGLKWEKDGIFLKPKVQEKMHNDGIWRKVRVDADNFEKNLIVQVRDVRFPEKGKVLFDVIVTARVKINFQQQFWNNGTRLYSGETRARCRTFLHLKCESTSRIEKSSSFLPDVIFRMRVLKADLKYDEFVVEHTAGLGGDLAKILGDAVHDCVKQWKPSLEKNLLEKANKSIAKAGDTKEVKLGIGKLLDGK